MKSMEVVILGLWGRSILPWVCNGTLDWLPWPFPVCCVLFLAWGLKVPIPVMVDTVTVGVVPYRSVRLK